MVPAMPLLRITILASLIFPLLAQGREVASAESSLRELVDSQALAWNTGDAGAWGRAYTEQSRFVNILGMVFENRIENEERHQALFEGIFRGSQLAVTIEHLDFPAPTLAVLQVHMTLTGYLRLPPGISETEPGALHTRMQYLAQLSPDGSWCFLSAQNTAISPLALKTQATPNPAKER